MASGTLWISSDYRDPSRKVGQAMLTQKLVQKGRDLHDSLPQVEKRGEPKLLNGLGMEGEPGLWGNMSVGLNRSVNALLGAER